MAKSTKKIQSSDKAWDKGELGCDEQFARVSKAITQKNVDIAIGLKPISIRLQESMVDDLKVIAEIHGLGYQPLMRQILNRFIDSEKKKIIREYLAEQQKQAIEEPELPPMSKTA
jgi:predicted DNA binding CopG/RHH family protein